MPSSKIEVAKLTAFLSKNRTLAEVAEKFTVTNATATKYMKSLVASGSVKVVGNTETGTRGRPARLYSAGTSA